MNFKTTYILFGILAVMLVALGFALWFDPTPPNTSAFIFPSVKDPKSPVETEQITRVEIERERPQQEHIVLVKDPETKRWEITQPRTLRADPAEIRALIDEVLQAKREEADRPANVKQWGLEPPAATITLSKDDRSLELKVGDVSPGTTSAVIYVLSSDRAKEPLAVKKNAMGSVLKGLSEFRQRDLLAGDVKLVKLSEGKKEPVELKKIEEGRWKYVKPAYGDADVEGDTAAPPAGALPKPLNGVRALLNDLTGLRVQVNPAGKEDDFVADGVTDFAKYGLDPAKNEKLLRIDIERSGDKPEKVGLLVAVDKKADDKGEKYYARRTDEDTVVRVAAKPVDAIRELLDKPDALRDRHLVSFGRLRQPDAIDVKNGSGLLEFRRPDAGKPWQLYLGDKVYTVDTTQFNTLLNQFTENNRLQTFEPAGAKESELGLDKSDFVVSFWIDGLAKDDKKDEKKDDKKDEKKDDKKDEKKDEKKEPAKPKLKDPAKPDVKLTFGREKGELVAVKRQVGDEVMLAQVPLSVLKAVREGPLAYLDKTLPKFEDAFPIDKNVTKVVIDRGTTYEIVKETKDGKDTWKIKKPTELDGRNADPQAITAILGGLNRLTALKLISEKPGDELLRLYGLKPPQTKVTLTLTKDGKDTTYEYEFGKEHDSDKNAVYARQSQRDIVFTVDKTVLTPLQGDLQDPVVFRFDAGKVTGLKMTGWYEFQAEPFVLDLERKEGSQWVAKNRPNFKVDAVKVRRFLDDLSHLRAERFVGKPKPEYELEVPKGALTVEITVENEKEPYLLTVGKLDADKGFFATTNRLKDEVIQVRREIFEGPKPKPSYFSP
jgi:hypothetical protein